mmetsp:Transcript_3342/g.5229  ORF Transcript_3342/g.5229 Transcript_3342/m.5229 type:complete len:1450 (-) Transcript_3342:361-4710(-)|eukprot:CAMPEP_0185021594 /NCGR_PEP_ID=MMETSP1103-20130426/4285_1 /TAXON_ID=36769 /ORGANISM="Paraphysomonas bandaiensis, Strain Caron Lab Isolate" /LENGTH=1449 /DNA_ID=CAMNT_0027553213 /DNA_START=67 /DNA_END=4416 /DNA_ORIENTATION=-
MNRGLSRQFSSRDSFSHDNPRGLPSISKIEKKNKKAADHVSSMQSDDFSLSRILFPGLPEHYPLRKKIAITKANSWAGAVWDILQIALSVLACIVYVADTYISSYRGASTFLLSEMIITQFFMVDFSLNFYLDGTLSYFRQSMTIVDIVTILPVYLTIATGNKATNLGFLRFVRILRLARIFRTFKALRNMSGVKRQLLSLTLTLLSMTFLAAGLVQLMENDIEQYQFDCQYINSRTDWRPSCSPSSPADDSCDCKENNCEGYYQRGDDQYKPSSIRCIRLTYFDAFYFIIVTVSTVGYGDIAPTTTYSRSVVLLFIVASLVVIPMQVNKLQVLLSMRSPYRNPYKAHPQESHVILCGHVNDKSKLEQFFKEFFHPDRAFSSSPEFHAVVLCPVEPNEDVRNLILSPMLDSRVTYVIGSALSVEDLKKVRADVAAGMFFLCNTEVSASAAGTEDAATVMRALSVSNFNPDLDCLVQVLRPEDRTILKDSDIDVILCLDEFKTTLQARNSICPGFSTFVENIFHSFGAVSAVVENKLDPWYGEYLHGARMEFYYVPLDSDFLKAISYSFDRLCEAIYMEWGIIVLGLCSADQDEMTFNPTQKDLGDHKTFKSFFSVFNVALIMADDQMQAEHVARGLTDINCVISMLNKINDEEDSFPCSFSDDKPGELTSQKPTAVFMTKQASKLSTLKNLKNNIVFKTGNGNSQKFAVDNLRLERLMSTRNSVPLSDSDDDDDTYVGYVATTHNTREGSEGRRMSSQIGGGMVGGTTNRVRPLGLLGVRKPISPIIEADTGRKSIRSERDRTSQISMKEESDEDDSDEENSETEDNVKAKGGGRKGMLQMLAPSAMLKEAEDVPKPKSKKPKPFLRGATVGANMNSNPKEIRKTLKELHELGGLKPPPSMSPSVTRKTPTATPEKSTSQPQERKGSGTSTPPAKSATPVPLNRILSRGATEPVLSRPRTLSNGEEIPGPPSEPPPTDSPPSTEAAKGTHAHHRGPMSPSEVLKEKAPPSAPPVSEVPAKIISPSEALKMAEVEEEDPLEKIMANFGVESQVITDTVEVDDHIIVFGNDTSLPMFISELRRPAVKGAAYHPLVIVSPELPSKWEAIKGRYNDVYVLLGSLTRSAVFNRANVENAFAVVLLCNRDGVTTVEEESIDSGTLFAYLKLEQYIPRDVFFSVELTCSSNMAVLNATIMRRVRRNPLEYFKPTKRQIRSKSDASKKPVLRLQSSGAIGFRKGSDENDRGGDMTKTETGDHLGRFTSKRNTIRQTMHGSMARLPSNIGRRASTIDHSIVEAIQIKENKVEPENVENRFWDATDTHHMLPVFASARAYVPSSFESLLVQSFFGVLTPLICEKLVCGQAGQTVMQADVPISMVGRKFLDLFRIMSYHHVICFGIYRAANPKARAILPYVYISPPPSTILGQNDRVFLYGKPSRLARAQIAIEKRQLSA